MTQAPETWGKPMAALLGALEAQIDYANNEYDKYNNSITVYNATYANFERYYNRTHMPLGKKIRYFGEPSTKEWQAANSVVKVTIEED
jgi:hypothetical protein